jgi:hypothetical protein
MLLPARVTVKLKKIHKMEKYACGRFVRPAAQNR